MEEFLKEYTENMITAINEGKISLKDIMLDCNFCPLYSKCHADAENGEDDMPCAEYIMKHYSFKE